ncbi:hypothetical protein [Dyella silvatica]|uniref:hypothetical protein n=1 Tax=Dyella silvatica TaxID=2992128 RepID=UPI00225B530D|nr:hypothetical protein [Dyella silvatica]
MTSEAIPLHAYDLIDQLNRSYPEVVYDAKENHDEFLMRSGERRLVLTLRRKMAREQEEQHVRQ